MLGAACLAASACASQTASHNGYPETLAEPWTEAEELDFDDRGEAEVVSSIDYPERKRARWYVFDLEAPGPLRARLDPVTFGRDEPAELGLELYDGAFRLLTAGEGREPGGELAREAEGLEAGRYYAHVYATERSGVADFTLRLIHEREGDAGSADFPDSVAFIDVLPEVPEVDDTPQKRPQRPQRPRRRRKPSPEPEAEPMAARIAGLTVTDSGTRIRINRGEKHGVSKGWKGRVTSQSGQPIPDGAFTVDRVTPQESFATVSASIDAVTAARHVRLEPP